VCVKREWGTPKGLVLSKNSSVPQGALKAVSRALDTYKFSHMVECLRFGDMPAGLSEVSHRHLTWTERPDGTTGEDR